MSNNEDRKQSRFWVYTLNNPSESERIHMDSLLGNRDEVVYAIYGREKSESGTSHYQGYVEWKKARGLGNVKTIGEGFGRAHLEIRRGRRDQAIKYCKKDGDYIEFGDIPNTDNATRLSKEEVRELALSGGSRAVAKDPRSTLQNIMFALKLLDQIEPEHNEEEKIYVVWYYGKTGVGKSRRARWEADDEYGRDNVYRKAEQSKWWNGYDRHPAVIIDDYRDSWWPFTELLSLLDRHPRKVEFKGGFRQWVPKKIWITSSMSPRAMYQGVGEDLQQLIRRIDIIMELVYEWKPPTKDDLLSEELLMNTQI